MTAGREEFHHFVDELPEEEVGPLLALVRDRRVRAADDEPEWPLPDWVGMLHSGEGDLAERSAEILRAELGEPQK